MKPIDPDMPLVDQYIDMACERGMQAYLDDPEALDIRGLTRKINKEVRGAMRAMIGIIATEVGQPTPYGGERKNHQYSLDDVDEMRDGLREWILEEFLGYNQQSRDEHAAKVRADLPLVEPIKIRRAIQL